MGTQARTGSSVHPLSFHLCFKTQPRHLKSQDTQPGLCVLNTPHTSLSVSLTGLRAQTGQGLNLI